MILIKSLLLSGSKEMKVDGTTPKTFSYTATATSLVRKIRIAMIDDGASTAIKFGSITGLTNGILIQSVIGGVTSTIATLKDNGDIITHFSGLNFGSSAVLSILGLVTPQGYLDSTDVIVGAMAFAEYPGVVDIILRSGDKIQAVVQDNLTSIDFLRMTVEIGTE